MNECDFCQRESEHLHPVNDDLWAICDACMDLHYRVLPRHLELKEQASKKCFCDDASAPRKAGCCLLVVGEEE